MSEMIWPRWASGAGKGWKAGVESRGTREQMSI